MPSCQSAIAYNSPIQQYSIYPFPSLYEFAYVLHHREELNTELRSYKSLLAQIDAAKQTLQQTSEQKVHRAVEELSAKVCQEDVRIFYSFSIFHGYQLMFVRSSMYQQCLAIRRQRLILHIVPVMNKVCLFNIRRTSLHCSIRFC